LGLTFRDQVLVVALMPEQLTGAANFVLSLVHEYKVVRAKPNVIIKTVFFFMEYNSLIILVMMLLVFRLNGNIKTLVFGNIMDSRIYFFCLTETVNTGPAKTLSDNLL
jgi:hypothetical protein